MLKLLYCCLSNHSFEDCHNLVKVVCIQSVAHWLIGELTKYILDITISMYLVGMMDLGLAHHLFS